MGQIETKSEESHKTDDKENTKSIANNNENALKEVTIKVQETPDEYIDVDSEKKDEDKDKKKNMRKENGCDFGCTIFFAMVAMLIFSTMSRTYSSYSGGGCGALYAAQPLLAYTCIGLACVIIRRLRKQIREQVSPLPEILSHFNEETEPKDDSNHNELFKEHVNDDKLDENHKILIESKPKPENAIPNTLLTESLGMSQHSEEKKCSSLLPLPLLPPPNSKRRSIQTVTQSANMSTLSVMDLPLINTTVNSDSKLTIVPNIDKNFEVNNDSKDIYITESNSINNCSQNSTFNTFWDTYDLNDKKF